MSQLKILRLAAIAAAGFTLSCHSENRHRSPTWPVINSASPSSGVEVGGETVTLTGSNFAPGITVAVGGVTASHSIVNASTLTIVTPPGTVGAQDLSISYRGHTETLGAAFTFIDSSPTIATISPDQGSNSGGTTVTITGTYLAPSATVSIGGAAATGIVIVSSTSITAVTPAGTAGPQDVSVTVSARTATLSDGFTYLDPSPTVSSILANTGPEIGGTDVTITGTNFVGGATVTIGGTDATSVNVVNSTTITATTPPGVAGARDVTVSTIDGIGTFSNGFTYIASKIYVTSWNNNAIRVYNLQDDGDVAPGQSITGASTTLNNPVGIYVTDTEIFIANLANDAILVFGINDAGNTAPTRSITGGATLLNRPTGMYVDVAASEIYAANRDSHSITVFNIADSGNVAPRRTISGPTSGIGNIEGLFLYNNEIITCEAQTLRAFDIGDDGDIAPNRVVSGGSTTLNFPQAVCVATEWIYVANLLSSRVLIFNIGDNGNLAPTRSISGAATHLGFVQAVYVTPTELFTASDGVNNVAVFELDASGDAAPLRVIQGASVGLNQPEGIFVK